MTLGLLKVSLKELLLMTRTNSSFVDEHLTLVERYAQELVIASQATALFCASLSL